MSDVQQVPTTAAPTEKDNNAKTHALIAYVMMVLGLFTGVFWLAGAIWGMVKKGDAAGTLYQDHYDNITKTFWVGLIIGIVGFVLSFVGIGIIVLIAGGIWCLYRVIKGLARLTSNKPYN
ncbi:DUF4870 family protein [Aliagarivorans marinus]|uniref:DUF4870 family protein n=1 Tax=Aliagarivorans marinus TaxID=561965 RepID=UPI0004185ECA|nr:YIP1 family protein [Aliagarivorans marinus]